MRGVILDGVFLYWWCVFLFSCGFDDRDNFLMNERLIGWKDFVLYEIEFYRFFFGIM